MVSWQAFPSLPPRAPLAFLSHLKLPFPFLSNACHAGYTSVAHGCLQERIMEQGGYLRALVGKNVNLVSLVSFRGCN